MENLLSSGVLVPLWILGAPLVAGVILHFTTSDRTDRARDTRTGRVPQPAL